MATDDPAPKPKIKTNKIVGDIFTTPTAREFLLGPGLLIGQLCILKMPHRIWDIETRNGTIIEEKGKPVKEIAVARI